MADTVRSMIPTIVVLAVAWLNLVSCEIKGNEKILNAGIVSINADLLISHCKFSGFKSGGVILQSTYQNTVKIADC